MGLFTVGKAIVKAADGLLDDALVQSKEIKKLSPEDAEEWLRNNPRPEDPAELNKWYKRKYRAGATGKQSTEADWDEEAWLAANPAPDFGGVRVKDLSPEQTREWKNWHSKKSAAKHKSTVRENARNFHRNNPSYQNERRANNADEINRAARERYANDPEYRAKVQSDARRSYASLPADVKTERAARAKQQLQEKIAAMSPEELSAYKAKQAASASKRRAGLLERTPSWANQDEIDEIYQIAQEITRVTGVPHDVDHIIPLLGYSGQRVNRTASGLHTPDNLLVVPKIDNLSKGAKFSPGSEVEQGGVNTARGLLYGAMDELGLIE